MLDPGRNAPHTFFLQQVDHLFRVQAGSNINITITNGGTCILTLRKATGYVSRIEPFRFGQYDDPTQVGA